MHGYDKQKASFLKGAIPSYQFRVKQLKILRAAIQANKTQIIAALYQDLHRPEFEAYFELELVKEIDYVISKLKQWMSTKAYLPSLGQFPALCYRQPQPLGNVLIISPWNYPIELTFRPLIGAIAAGNRVIIKPSELSPHTSNLIARIINENFSPDYITVVEGGISATTELLQLHFDHIFFTGSTAVGKIIAAAAAKHLTPTTLELGGKSPAIVCADADLALTARRILWGKFINAGQTCIAPDYVLVDEQVYGKLVSHMKDVLNEFYPDGAKSGKVFGRIVNRKNWQRLVDMMSASQIIIGGEHDIDELYIAPTLLAVKSRDELIMHEEIFGPLLPILKFNNLDDELSQLKTQDRPLALYLFSSNRETQLHVQQETISGGMAINDCVLHISNHHLSFGGVGASGMGGYHGKHTFDLFSHHKTVLRRFKFELPWRYAPYSKLKLWFIKFMTR